LTENEATAALTALLALARGGEAGDQRNLATALMRFPLDSLTEEQKLLKLRVIQLSFLRQGKPPGDLAQLASENLNRHYPAPSWPLNRELSRLLIYLEAPGVVAKTLALLEAAPTQEEQVHYVAQLRNLRSGWTIEDRRRHLSWWLQPRASERHPREAFQWFADVNRQYVDGAGMDNYLRDFRRETIANLNSAERTALASLIEAPIVPAQLLPATSRKFVREWKMADLAPHLNEPLKDRDFDRGRQAFVDSQCLRCHRFGNDGGATGPELAAAGSKYTRRDLLESILEPSKVISDQYQNTTVLLTDGDSMTGKLFSQSDAEVVIETDPASRSREKIPRNKIQQVKPAVLSPMPEGLVNILTKEEVLDLLAYLESNGQADSPAFRKSAGRK
jgi:putative heme-binding domain-containing protein